MQLTIFQQPMKVMKMSTKKRLGNWLIIAGLVVTVAGCKDLKLVTKTENNYTPASYQGSQDTLNSAKTQWNHFFKDPDLITLIDTALKNNQELNIVMQEITIAKAEVRAKKGEFLPSANLQVGAGVDKVGRYTRNGALEANNQIAPGKEFPEPMSDMIVGVNASWEIDIWRKLRNSRDAAANRYLASVEGKNFMVTHLVSEIANSYYELIALDNKLEILNQTIDIQSNALQIVKMQKIAGMVSELAVKKFEAEVLKNQSHVYYIRQSIVEAENKINFLVGRFPQPVQRNSKNFTDLVPDTIYSGIPSQLLQNRPDIRKAELELVATKFDLKAARADFYPSLRLTAGAGFNAFNVQYFIKAPQSLIYNIAGDLVAPLINRNAIKAKYFSANAKQIQAAYNYEKSILNGYIEVTNSLSMISNLKKSYDLKSQQVQALTQSITISTNLFSNARADYMEVLMTQRDAVESKFELIEMKQQQLSSWISMYQALGGGWK
ncbi:Toluene efflux pump outer membrane protein TtgI precursor [compost metagenome]